MSPDAIPAVVAITAVATVVFVLLVDFQLRKGWTGASARAGTAIVRCEKTDAHALMAGSVRLTCASAPSGSRRGVAVPTSLHV